MVGHLKAFNKIPQQSNDNSESNNNNTTVNTEKVEESNTDNTEVRDTTVSN